MVLHRRQLLQLCPRCYHGRLGASLSVPAGAERRRLCFEVSNWAGLGVAKKTPIEIIETLLGKSTPVSPTPR
jgi:hypothetical protein